MQRCGDFQGAAFVTAAVEVQQEAMQRQRRRRRRKVVQAMTAAAATPRIRCRNSGLMQHTHHPSLHSQAFFPSAFTHYWIHSAVTRPFPLHASSHSCVGHTRTAYTLPIMRNTHHTPPTPLPGGRRDVRLKRLIWEILMDAPNKEMQLQTLYLQMQQRHVNLATRQSDWRGTVRHILSAGPYFRRVHDSERRGCWRINDDYVVSSSVKEAEPQPQVKLEANDEAIMHWHPQFSCDAPLPSASTIELEAGLTKKRSFSQPNMVMAGIFDEQTPIVPTVKQELGTLKVRSYSQSDASSIMTNGSDCTPSSLSPFTSSSSRSSASPTSTTSGPTQPSVEELLAELATLQQFRSDQNRRQVLQFDDLALRQGLPSPTQVECTSDIFGGNKPSFDRLAPNLFPDATTLSPMEFLDQDYFPNWNQIEAFNMSADGSALPAVTNGEMWPIACLPALRGDLDSLASFRF